ncbi:MAG: macro domain-containing protein [Ruminiclostridium sp.]|nr:macro domain-containing protein [Ruminiclostridium sp.]
MEMMKKNRFTYAAGDILDLADDALVMTTDESCRPFGTLNGDLWNHGGAALFGIRRDLRHKGEKLKAGDIRITRGYNRTMNKDYTCIVACMPLCTGSWDRELIADCYRRCIETAVMKGKKNLFFPLIGESDSTDTDGLLICAEYAINDALGRLGADKPIDVTVVLSDEVFSYIVPLEEMMTGGHLPEPEWQAAHGSPERAAGEYAAKKQAFLTSKRERERSAVTESIVKRIKREKEAFLAENADRYADEKPEKILKIFRTEKIDGIIQNWCDSPNPLRGLEKYARAENSRNSLAQTTGISAQTLTDINGKHKLPARETLLALAAGMKLPYDERLELMMYRDEDMRYPSTEKEILIEKCIDETGYDENDMTYKELNDLVYKMSGERFSIYDGTGISLAANKDK